MRNISVIVFLYFGPVVQEVRLKYFLSRAVVAILFSGSKPFRQFR